MYVPCSIWDRLPPCLFFISKSDLQMYFAAEVWESPIPHPVRLKLRLCPQKILQAIEIFTLADAEGDAHIYDTYDIA